MVTKFADVSVFQPSNLEYFLQLKRDGAKFCFTKLTEGTDYINPKAPKQINNSIKVFGSAGVYHFYHGESAKFFIYEARKFGLDFKSTKVALDVEATDLPYYCTNSINKFESQLVQVGFKPGNIWTYCSTSWINSDRVIPSKLKYGFVWVAMYPYSNVYSDNKLKSNSRLNPNYNAWQFSGLGSQDWSYDYTGTLLNNAKPSKRKPVKKPAPKKQPVSHYLTHGKYFEVVTDNLNGYKDPEFEIKNGNVLTRGSRIHGQVLRFKGYTRLDTPIGWYSTNTKFLKELK